MNYTTKPGAHSSIRINVLEHLPEERYLAALQRVRDAIAAGRPLQFYDDTTPGDKSTSCSWGLCHDSKDTWPDAQDHLFPSDFEKTGVSHHFPAPTRARWTHGDTALTPTDASTHVGCFKPPEKTRGQHTTKPWPCTTQQSRSTKPKLIGLRLRCLPINFQETIMTSLE